VGRIGERTEVFQRPFKVRESQDSFANVDATVGRGGLEAPEGCLDCPIKALLDLDAHRFDQRPGALVFRVQAIGHFFRRTGTRFASALNKAVFIGLALRYLSEIAADFFN
jgi:hypothetical protein